MAMENPKIPPTAEQAAEPQAMERLPPEIAPLVRCFLHPNDVHIVASGSRLLRSLFLVPATPTGIEIARRHLQRHAVVHNRPSLATTTPFDDIDFHNIAQAYALAIISIFGPSLTLLNRLVPDYTWPSNSPYSHGRRNKAWELRIVRPSRCVERVGRMLANALRMGIIKRDALLTVRIVAMQLDSVLLVDALLEALPEHIREKAMPGLVHDAAWWGAPQVLRYLSRMPHFLFAIGLRPNTAGNQAVRGPEAILPAAVHSGVTAVVDLLLGHGVDPSATISISIHTDGELILRSVTPLQCAAIHNHLGIVKLLLDTGAPINQGDLEGWTALHWAADYGHTEIVQLLLAEDADVDAVNTSNRTALHLASANGHADVVQLLLAHNANPNFPANHNLTPLHLATSNHHLNVVRLLLTHNASPSPRNNAGQTPLHLVILERDPTATLTTLLLTHNADANARSHAGQTPLHHATLASREPHVRVLLAHGATPTSPDADGNTPLHHAITKAHLPILTLLLAHTPTASPRNNTGETPLHLAVREHSPVAALTTLLLAHGADPNARCDAGTTPLHLACGANRLAHVQALLANGAIATLHDGKGLTAVHLACMVGGNDALRLLLAGNTVDPNIPTLENNLRPIHFGFTHVAVLETLLAAGADVDAKRDDTGETALHLAAARNAVESVRVLLGKGRADPMVLDKSFRRAGERLPRLRREVREELRAAMLAIKMRRRREGGPAGAGTGGGTVGGI
ncbi:hypothetical protein HDU96_008740 [Phlyctochytrium bullatum]|nr:hypothetical protein HDU96_008740 [Phlyctochytrium bullatum]